MSDFSNLGGDIFGGIGDAFSGATNYLSNLPSNIGNTVSGWFGGGDASTGSTSAPSSGDGSSISIPQAANDTSFMNPGSTTQAANAFSSLNSVNPASLSSINYTSGAPTSDTSAVSNTTQLPGNPNTPQNANSGGVMGALGLNKANPLGVLAAGGGLLYNAIEGSPSSSAEKNIKNLANSQNAQGQQLESYINNGTLPPGAQQWVNQQTAAQTAAIKAKYAQLGMSGSTPEAEELNNVQSQATSQMFTIASQLLNTGVTESNASGTLYNYLMNAENADTQDISKAVQNFVAAMAGGSGAGQNISLSLGKSA